ncbi:transcriptional regulator, MerR family protein [Ketogulonicigenium robustum]|uniref:Transcriptional regulator, MerR family protein n=1 Tax=Ketogulonicigenium robustum TaxID=92947 RepID=A0A1W6NZ67_9RHOB|nr:MerR family transcriptional regulator [Ketogulonicigenium robustum]ARO14542.1 transcriptional regulator, MerR family protein [Ketogulonicigenium robustum]
MAASRDKAETAFRTISEVAEWLDLPTHVLRFWESKFSQIHPVKGAGGRRYYRPDDMALLSGIKVLLRDQGLTIKGAQKLIREQGAKYVASLGEQPKGLAFRPVPQPRKQTPVVKAIVYRPIPEARPSLLWTASHIAPDVRDGAALSEALSRLEALRAKMLSAA